MSTLGKTLILIGSLFILAGLVVFMASRGKVPFLGKLPGDILVQKKNFTFYFPLATSLVVSVGVSLILFIIARMRK
ncbi:MAG: DUF2905 domain-containing protein [Candidatus Omnitrophota bacterium]